MTEQVEPMLPSSTPPCTGITDESDAPAQFARTRPPELVGSINRELSMIRMFQGHVLHAGDVKGGRPLPKLSAIEYKRAWSNTALPLISLFTPNAVLYTIHNRRFPSSDPEVINLPAATYWQLAMPGDVVLLSDLNTNHYTRIASVDQKQGFIDLLDRWPRIFTEFIGVSPEPVEGKAGPLAGARLVRFSREEFERLFVAAIVLDIAGFAPWLATVLPAGERTPELKAALARSLLRAGANRAFPIAAADLINDAIREANRGGNTAFVDENTPLMLFAVDSSRWAFLLQGNTAKAEIAIRYLGDIEARYGAQAVGGIDSDDCVLLAFLASKVVLLEALPYLDVAIMKNPANHHAYLLRASIQAAILRKWLEGSTASETPDILAQQVAVQGIDDASKALSWLDSKKDEIAKRRADYLEAQGIYWEEGRTAMEEDAAEQAREFLDRIAALSLRGAIRLFSADLEGAKADGLEIIRLDGALPDGFEIAGEAEVALGHTEASEKLLNSGVARAPHQRSWRISPPPIGDGARSSH